MGTHPLTAPSAASISGFACANGRNQISAYGPVVQAQPVATEARRNHVAIISVLATLPVGQRRSFGPAPE